MVEAVMLWNEPNNLSHWDFKIDPEWKTFAEMTIAAAQAIRDGLNPAAQDRPGGISPDIGNPRYIGSTARDRTACWSRGVSPGAQAFLSTLGLIGTFTSGQEDR